MADSNKKVDMLFAVILAVISALSGIGVAIFSNFDKIFPPENQIIVEYQGYNPTDDFETELRYYFEIIKVKNVIKRLQKSVIEETKNNLRIQLTKSLSNEFSNPEEVISEILSSFSKIMRQDPENYDELINKFLPIFKDIFTVEELHELNKFYSTDIMKNLTQKNILIQERIGKLLVKDMTIQSERRRKMFRQEVKRIMNKYDKK